MKRTASIALTATALVAVAGGVASASIPDAGGTINGCYRSDDLGAGALYVIDSADTCPAGFTALDWDSTQPVGLRGYEVVEQTFTRTGPASPGSVTRTLDCPAGKVVLGSSMKSDVTAYTIATNGSGVEYTIATPSLVSGDTYVSPQSITCATKGV